MTEHEADLPDKYTLGDSWGLGWIRFGWDGRRLIGHDGNTLGQAAFLRVLPDEGLAVTLLTNGGNARDLYEELYREIFRELAGVEMPRPLEPPTEPVQVDVTPRLGTYERAGARLEVLGRRRRAGAAHDRDRADRRARIRAHARIPDGRGRRGSVRRTRSRLPDVDGDDLLRPADAESRTCISGCGRRRELTELPLSRLTKNVAGRFVRDHDAGGVGAL